MEQMSVRGWKISVVHVTYSKDKQSSPNCVDHSQSVVWQPLLHRQNSLGGRLKAKEAYLGYVRRLFGKE